jgi:phage FluMu gp28-like protein
VDETRTPSILDELVPVAELPEGHDPLADGILMAHQRDWIEDRSPLKLCVKGRRTGITYAEALDDTITAASARAAGGDNVFYIGDTKDKGREFIRYVAHMARIVAKELSSVDEFLFEDQQPDGKTKHIAAYRISFSSGFQIVALSSRPSNIRGLQGIVVIDEAAFHKDVGEVLEAVNALLIWGGKIRIISTHNGEDSPFNQLVKDCRAGLYDYSLHHIPFSAAVRNGLYERRCLIDGKAPKSADKKAWLQTVFRSYGPRTEARDEELEAIPRKSSGVYLPRALVQKAQVAGVPIIAYAKGEGWYLDDRRLDEAKLWFADNLKPVLDRLDPRRRTVLGQDFGRDGDLSVIMVAQDQGLARWCTSFQLELRRIPFDVQQWLLFEIIKACPLFQQGQLDARGNGQSHAEAAQQHFGVDKIVCVKATLQWYALAFPDYRAALEEASFQLPAGEDVIADHRLVVLRNGFPTMSDDKVKGQDGEFRHGDSAIAGLLAFMATKGEIGSYGYEALASPGQALRREPDWRRSADDADDADGDDAMMPRLRGGL